MVMKNIYILKMNIYNYLKFKFGTSLRGFGPKCNREIELTRNCSHY